MIIFVLSGDGGSLRASSNGRGKRKIPGFRPFLPLLAALEKIIELNLLLFRVNMGTYADASPTLLCEMFEQTRRMARFELLSAASTIHGVLAGYRIFGLDSVITVPHGIEATNFSARDEGRIQGGKGNIGHGSIDSGEPLDGPRYRSRLRNRFPLGSKVKGHIIRIVVMVNINTFT